MTTTTVSRAVSIDYIHSIATPAFRSSTEKDPFTFACGPHTDFSSKVSTLETQKASTDMCHSELQYKPAYGRAECSLKIHGAYEKADCLEASK
jgi:hypothetical protein